MPRPKPKEELHPVSHRFTDAQIQKITRNGGSNWVRHLVETAEEEFDKAATADLKVPKCLPQ